MAVDSFVSAGMSFIDLRWWSMGFPLTNCQMYLSKEPNSCLIWRSFWALVIAACILALFRITPGLVRIISASAGVNFATVFGLKSAKAFLSASLRFKISSQVKPAWKPSSVRSSNSFWSS